jgi:hypothetical protein
VNCYELAETPALGTADLAGEGVGNETVSRRTSWVTHDFAILPSPPGSKQISISVARSCVKAFGSNTLGIKKINKKDFTY